MMTSLPPSIPTHKTDSQSTAKESVSMAATNQHHADVQAPQAKDINMDITDKAGSPSYNISSMMASPPPATANRRPSLPSIRSVIPQMNSSNDNNNNNSSDQNIDQNATGGNLPSLQQQTSGQQNGLDAVEDYRAEEQEELQEDHGDVDENDDDDMAAAAAITIGAVASQLPDDLEIDHGLEDMSAVIAEDENDGSLSAHRRIDMNGGGEDEDGDNNNMMGSSSSLQTPKMKKERLDYGNGPQPKWSETQQLMKLWAADGNTALHLEINSAIDNGFFLDGKTWTCYRRNYFQLHAGYSIIETSSRLPIDFFGQNIHGKVLLEISRDRPPVPVVGFCISVNVQVINSARQGVHLVQHTGKRERGPQHVPDAVSVLPSVGDIAEYAARIEEEIGMGPTNVIVSGIPVSNLSHDIVGNIPNDANNGEREEDNMNGGDDGESNKMLNTMNDNDNMSTMEIENENLAQQQQHNKKSLGSPAPGPRPPKAGTQERRPTTSGATLKTPKNNNSSSVFSDGGSSSNRPSTAQPLHPYQRLNPHIHPPRNLNHFLAFFTRLQFNSSTAKGRTQEYYQLKLELCADVGGSELYVVAMCESPPVVVRGRGPGHYKTMDGATVGPPASVSNKRQSGGGASDESDTRESPQPEGDDGRPFDNSNVNTPRTLSGNGKSSATSSRPRTKDSNISNLNSMSITNNSKSKKRKRQAGARNRSNSANAAEANTSEYNQDGESGQNDSSSSIQNTNMNGSGINFTAGEQPAQRAALAMMYNAAVNGGNNAPRVQFIQPPNGQLPYYIVQPGANPGVGPNQYAQMIAQQQQQQQQQQHQDQQNSQQQTSSNEFQRPHSQPPLGTADNISQGNTNMAAVAANLFAFSSPNAAAGNQNLIFYPPPAHNSSSSLPHPPIHLGTLDQSQSHQYTSHHGSHDQSSSFQNNKTSQRGSTSELSDSALSSTAPKVKACVDVLQKILFYFNEGHIDMIAELLPNSFEWLTHAPSTFPFAGHTSHQNDTTARYTALSSALPSARMSLDRVWLSQAATFARNKNAAPKLHAADEIFASVTLSFMTPSDQLVSPTSLTPSGIHPTHRDLPEVRRQVSLIQNWSGWQFEENESNNDNGKQRSKSRRNKKVSTGKSPASNAPGGSVGRLLPGRLEEWFDTYSMAEALASKGSQENTNE